MKKQIAALGAILAIFTAHFAHFGNIGRLTTGLCAIATIGIASIFANRFCEPAPQSKPKSASFDWGMHYFRAFAILNIVLLHVVTGLGYGKLANCIFWGSTIYFLFISGYLCQYLDLRRKTVASVYYAKKIKNVFTPYLICTAVTLVIVWVFPSYRYGIVSSDNVSWRLILKTFALGQAQIPYWYIPFVSMLFLISPILLKLSTEKLAITTLSAFALALIFPTRGRFFSLTWPRIFLVYSFFTWAYLFGFIYARKKDVLERYVIRYAPIALLFGLAVLVWMLKPGLISLDMVHEDLARSLQKLFLTFAALSGLTFIKTKRIAILDAIANYSFPIFFVHMFFIQDYINLRNWALARLMPPTVIGHALECALIASFLLEILLIVVCLKKVLGRYSRYCIGA